MISKLISFVFLSVFMLIVIWGAGWILFAMNIASTKNTNVSGVTTNNIAVLTGGKGRINAALDLLATKDKGNLLISGVNKETTKADILAQWKNNKSKIICCITLGYKSTDTITNALEVKEWADKNDLTSFYLVTSNYHMPRAKMEVKAVFPESNIYEYPIFSEDIKSWKGRFWKLSFSEYNKTILRWMQNLAR